MSQAETIVKDSLFLPRPRMHGCECVGGSPRLEVKLNALKRGPSHRRSNNGSKDKSREVVPKPTKHSTPGQRLFGSSTQAPLLLDGSVCGSGAAEPWTEQTDLSVQDAADSPHINLST